MALLLLPALTGCTRVPEEEREPAPALSVPEVPWAAPDGDGVVGQERVAMLYLNGTRGRSRFRLRSCMTWSKPWSRC